MLKRLLAKTHIPKWLFFVLLLVLVLRLPSFFEPYHYGDESIYLTLGQGIRQGVPLYKSLHDNKPPLLYITAAVAGNLFWFKVILATWLLATILIFRKFVQKLFLKNIKLEKAAVWIFALLTSLPLFEGNIANAELFMIGPTIGAFYLLLFSQKSIKNLLLSGVLFSISTLFKVPALFDIFAIVSFWLIYSYQKKTELIKVLKNLSLVFIGFVTPILLTILWYYFRGAFREYLVAAFLQNVGYLSTWKDPAVEEASFLVKNGSLFFKFGLVVVGNIILCLKKKVLKKEFVFLTAWILFSSFAVSLSERPYPHYFVQVLPPVAILFSLFLTDKSLLQSLALIPLGLAFLVPFYYKFWYYPTSSYYLRFVKLATGQLAKEDYLNSFDSRLSRNYQVADLVNKITNRKDRIFIWGDSANLYALTRRLPVIKYAADYHIRDFSSNKEVAGLLSAKSPTVIIVLPEAPLFTELRLFLANQYLLLAQVEGVEIYKILKPEVKSAIITNFF